ncbi:MAG: LD-carboxypeptidase [Calditrichaeota bacterium]|nr:LD-carboxypeptidase [Calditrichota bacterium]
MEIVKPGRLGKPLKAGDLIKVISPAGPAEPKLVEAGMRRLRTWGYRVEAGQYAFDKNGYFAGSDANRLSDLLSALMDADVKAVICSRGGYGSLRLLDKLPWLEIQKLEPKLFVGFSDIGALQLALWTRCGWASLSAPLTANGLGGSDINRPAMRHLQDWLNGDNRSLNWNGSETTRLKALNRPSGKGVLLPLCLSILTALVGTPYLPSLTGGLIVIEDIGEPAYRIDRMLWQLKNSNVLDDIAGFIFGRFILGENEITESVIESIRYYFPDKPIWTGLPYGHFSARLTVPLGLAAEITTSGELKVSLR